MTADPDRRTKRFGNRRADRIFGLAIALEVVGSAVVVSTFTLQARYGLVGEYLNNVVFGFFLPANLAVLGMLAVGSIVEKRTVPREDTEP